MNEQTKAVLSAVVEELGAVAQDQQRLADDLVGLLHNPAPGERMVRRLQEFDSLRQRLELLGETVGMVAEADGGDVAEAVLARMTLSSVRMVFARHLGRAVEAPVAAGDVELF